MRKPSPGVVGNFDQSRAGTVVNSFFTLDIFSSFRGILYLLMSIYLLDFGDLILSIVQTIAVEIKIKA